MMAGRLEPRHILGAAAILLVAVSIAVGTQGTQARGRDSIEVVIEEGWGKAPVGTGRTMRQDRTQRECTLYGNAPPDRAAVAIGEREWRSIVFPSDGTVLGDWRRGETLARSLPRETAVRDGEVPSPPREAEAPAAQCLSCHQLDRRDIGQQRSGPALIGYARTRGQYPGSAKLVYEQIYNSNAVVACSAMPRFGAHKVLSPEQIRDIVAYLLAPDSPVNSAHSAIADQP